MRALKSMIPAVLLGAGLLVCVTASYGTQEFAKKEKKQCTFCHGKMEAKDAMKKNLNDAGKYYQSHKSLEGYTAKK
jgi:CHASE1-domain containing sensor protein